MSANWALLFRALGVALVIAFAAAPWYVLPSGVPQPADYALALWSCGVFLLAGLSSLLRVPTAFAVVWTLFVTYVSITNLTWTALAGDWAIAYNSLYYIFNWAVCLAVAAFVIANPAEHWRFLRMAIAAATITSFVLLLVHFDASAARQVGGFNNPNQLGYFSLLMLSCASVLYGARERLTAVFWSVVVLSVVTVLMSFSLTAAAGLIVALTGLVLRHRLISQPGRVLPLALGLILMLGALAMSGKLGYIGAQWEVRLGRLEAKIQEPHRQRAYDRITASPGHLLLGAGEGGYWRFHGPQREIHSTVGTLVFSYGIPGVVLFATLFWLACRGKGLAVALLAAAPLVYSLTHQGMRSTAFWLLLTLVFLSGRHCPESGKRTPGTAL